MPSMLETPETLHEELALQEGNAATPAAVSTMPRNTWASRLARLLMLLPGSGKRSPQLYVWPGEVPRPLEAPLDRVAREFPQSFLLAHCG
jgi:hypothetical protein